MLLKIKGLFLLTSLILLQSCSGGKIGSFLESSFDNLDNIKIEEKQKKSLVEKKDNNKKNIDYIIKENKPNNNLRNNIKDINSEKKNKDESQKIKKSIDITKNNLGNIKDINSEKTIDKSSKSFDTKKNELQSYKIIFILKDVDPKDPIEDLRTILRNSEVNFEIEKIERFLDSKKTMNGN
tara:strand:+ start:924 stop:1466 length:543 start_codon:yes stop_codon:yes gene_type:complete